MADKAESLVQFARPGCAAAIWRRQPKSGFQSWIDALDPEQLPSGRVVGRPEAALQIVGKLCEMADTPDGPERTMLIEDVSALAHIFSEMMQSPYVRVRLSPVRNNSCRKFHIDAITARLVCTYRGTGTQYGVSKDGAEPTRVFTVPTGAPILLRGTLWSDPPASGLLHRSPPIEGTNETRLVLVIDPIFDTDTAA